MAFGGQRPVMACGPLRTKTVQLFKPDEDILYKSTPTEAIASVLSETATAALVAVECDEHDTAHEVYDALLLNSSLEVVAEVISDVDSGSTRLWVIKKSTAIQSKPQLRGQVKTAMVLTLGKREPGLLVTEHLHKVLGVLSVYKLDVVKLQLSLSNTRKAFSLCFVDVVSHNGDASTIEAIAVLEASGITVRVLGSFPWGTPGFSIKDVRAKSEMLDTATDGEHMENAITMNDRFPLNPKVTNVNMGRNMVLFGKAKHLEAEGHKVYMLSFGEPDFLPPDRVIRAGIQAFKDGKVRYTDMRGDPNLRELISEYLSLVKKVQYDPATEIMVSSGGQQGLFYVFHTILRPGDKVILPTPYWAVHAALVDQMQGKLLVLPGKIGEDYLVNPRALEAMLTANPDTKMFLLCNPSNPVGTLHPPERLEEIAAILRKPQFRHVIVIADEIYEQLIYHDDDETPGCRVHQSFATLPGMRDRTITINGFSKAYAMTGLRVGFIAAPSHFISRCVLCQSIFASSVNSVGQMAAVEAVTMELEYFQQGRSRIQGDLAELDKKRKYVVKRLQQIPKLRFAYPTSAFYVFVDLSAFFLGKCAHVVETPNTSAPIKLHDVADLCEYLLDQFSVAVTPGVDFGDENGLRISYAGAQESIERAMDSLELCLTTSLRFVDV